GRNEGQKCASSCLEQSNCVTALACRPVAETRYRAAPGPAPKRITPSRLQVAPPGFGASPIICAGAAPPGAPTSTFFSLRVLQNPIKRLSGDQKGSNAPSVPVNGWALSESSRSIQSRRSPPGSDPVNARRWPSGEGQHERISPVRVVRSGTSTWAERG